MVSSSASVASSAAPVAPFDAAFERLVAVVGAATPPADMQRLHRAFEQRTGEFGPDDPWFESRSRAFWDDVMVRSEHAANVLAAAELDAADRAWADALGRRRAHRGLFQSRQEGPELVLEDVISGAELRVHEVDAASRDAIASTRGVLDGTVVALGARLALLPGAMFHPEGAEEAIAKVVAAARARKLSSGALLDALLRMELSLRTLSRVKLSYAYRVEALVG